jgi:hypothetical protein
LGRTKSAHTIINLLRWTERAASGGGLNEFARKKKLHIQLLAMEA